MKTQHLIPALLCLLLSTKIFSQSMPEPMETIQSMPGGTDLVKMNDASAKTSVLKKMPVSSKMNGAGGLQSPVLTSTSRPTAKKEQDNPLVTK